MKELPYPERWYLEQAAGELLEACEQALSFLNLSYTDWNAHTRGILEDAIAKAYGR